MKLWENEECQKNPTLWNSELRLDNDFVMENIPEEFLSLVEP